MGRPVVGGVPNNVLKRAGVGRIGRTPVLILPGQVESAMIGFHGYGLSILGRLLGSELKPFVDLPLATPITVRHAMDSTFRFPERAHRAVPLRWEVSRYGALLAADAFG